MRRRKKLLPTVHDWLILTLWLGIAYWAYQQDPAPSLSALKHVQDLLDRLIETISGR
jgi:hypothetical protein